MSLNTRKSANPLSDFTPLGILIFSCILLLSCADLKKRPDTDVKDTSPKEIVRYRDVPLPAKPNILWLVAEDLSPYLPFYGDSTIETPNLSRLAAEGICFDRFFASAPVCAPARASIATGMYPTRIAAGHMRTGGNPKFLPRAPYEALPPSGTRMMSEWLRMEGYHCTNNPKEDYQFRKTPTAWDESSTEAHWRNRREGQPFFAIFNFNITHESRIWAKANDPWQVDSTMRVNVPPYLPDTKIGRRDMRRMYSNIVEMDKMVGDILTQLEEDGELENTIIFWYSDHGGPLPRQKRLLYDSGLKVPMIVRFPNKEYAGTRDDRMINFLDLAPTVLSLAGIAPKHYMDGHDFLGAHQPADERKYIFAAADRFDETTDCIRAARDYRYKYLRYYQQEKPMFLHVNYRDQQPIMQELYRLQDLDSLSAIQQLWFRPEKPAFEFFDTKNDPHEINDLANDPAYREKIQELSDAMDRWLADIDDTGIIPEDDLLERIWPEGIQPVTADPEINRDVSGISISCDTDGASIGYKVYTDVEPDVWMVYKGTFDIQPGDKVKAVAHRIGFVRSDEVIL